MMYASAKAYRVKGGAVVTITRADGTVRRHRVNARRFAWLRTLFSFACDRGSFSNSGFDCVLAKPLGPEIAYMRGAR